MEVQIVSRLNHLGSWTWIDSLSWLISRMPMLGWFFLFIGIFLFIKYPQKRKQLIIALFVGSLLFLLINEGVCKHLLVDITGIRIRPYLAHPELSAIGKQLTDSSFPSSHMASTMMILSIFVRFLPTIRPLALIVALLMAFSRMHNAMHYPSDVFAGAVLGMVYAMAGIRAGKKWQKYFPAIGK